MIIGEFLQGSQLARRINFSRGGGNRVLKSNNLAQRGRDFNASHLLIQPTHLAFKGIPLVGSDGFSACFEILGRNAVDDVDGGGASHEQNMLRESVRINRKPYLWICSQRRYFGGAWHSRKNNLSPVSRGSQPGSQEKILRVLGTLAVPEYGIAIVLAGTD